MKDSDSSSDGMAVNNRRSEATYGPLQAFKRSVRLFFTKDMGLLFVAFFYMGKRLVFVMHLDRPFDLRPLILQASPSRF